jgi:hypothetical protein
MRLLLLSLLLLTSLAQAEVVKRTLCVFDPLGANGGLYSVAKDYRTLALEWGVDFHLRAYTDEKIASDDFKAQQCDAVVLTGARARPFNTFTATVEAIGAVPSENIMQQLVQLISSPKAERYMVEGRYEVMGVLPAGPIYLFVRDRGIDSVEELSGKRIATIDYDEPSKRLVNHVGASVVPANSANFSGMFNNGSVDAAYAPALAYKPLELYKGLGEGGGIIRFNLAYLDFQLVAHRERFPKGFGAQSRQALAQQFERVAQSIAADTAAIESHYWVDLTAEARAEYNQMLRDIRMQLRDEGVYHASMLTLLRKLRCRDNPTAAECVDKLE